ncbi:hypothetical protein [Pseudomonas vanderleydeniana]|uniref:hypothetical protein n=1 Tax=Pseudomonas vanderleydeniana TaxID=2745495 RepID=UPI001CEC24E2|nr:hypothetical protein [Pseudomonas vanderleydeniana]
MSRTLTHTGKSFDVLAPQVEWIRPWSATEARLTFHQRLMDQLAIEHRRKAA